MCDVVLPVINPGWKKGGFPFSKLTPEESDDAGLLLGFNGVLHLLDPSVPHLFPLSGTYER